MPGIVETGVLQKGAKVAKGKRILCVLCGLLFKESLRVSAPLREIR
jgi:hypothetical protein